MADYGYVDMPAPEPAFSRRVAIVGVGETDYHDDYRASRQRPPGYEPPTPEGLVKVAFDRALADSGLERSDIDALAVSFTYGGPDPAEMARLLGLAPRRAFVNGHIMAGPLPAACAEIIRGDADRIAMVYSVASRAIGRQYGGSSTYGAGSVGGPSSYYYFHPWGWSSQAAHWALMFTHYQAAHGASEADLGAVAVQVRRHASADTNAVMRKPVTIEDYLASRYIVKPLHLLDLCLVNDGAVCLILSRAELARGLPHTPVLVAGWGEAAIRHSKLKTMVKDRLRPQMREAGAQAFAMAGLSPDDVQHFEGYDASTVHLINQVEGYGFAEPGTGIDFCKAGQMTHGGRLPTNTSGGNLSGSYMHGWSQVAEVVRQLRHEAGPRQVEGVRVSLSSLAQTDAVHPLLFERGS